MTIRLPLLNGGRSGSEQVLLNRLGGQAQGSLGEPLCDCVLSLQARNEGKQVLAPVRLLGRQFDLQIVQYALCVVEHDAPRYRVGDGDGSGGNGWACWIV